MLHSIYQSEIFQCLLEQEQHFEESHFREKNRIALFDLDDTLVLGNIGDAVFAQILIDGFSLPLTWKEYRLMCRENPVSASVEVVRAMEGVTLEYITQVSKRILQSNQRFIVCEDERVRLPKPNLMMQEIIKLLRERYYSIFIVSKSNDISAKITGSVLFGVPINNIAGIKSKMLNNKITHNILEPIPVGMGKVAQFNFMSGNRVPMIVATDDESDIPLIRLCDPDGIVLIMGENPQLYEKAKRELFITVHIHQIPQLGFTAPIAVPYYVAKT